MNKGETECDKYILIFQNVVIICIDTYADCGSFEEQFVKLILLGIFFSFNSNLFQNCHFS